MMFKLFGSLFVVCLLLAGCVLQSKVPLFNDKSGALLLKPYGHLFSTLNLDDGNWQKQKDRVALKASGRHYIALNDTTEVILKFVPLFDSWSVLQAQEKGKPATYVLAEMKPDAKELHALSCSELKKNSTLAKKLVIKGEDCLVGKDFGIADFKTLAKTAEPTIIKLVPEGK